MDRNLKFYNYSIIMFSIQSLLSVPSHLGSLHVSPLYGVSLFVTHHSLTPLCTLLICLTFCTSYLHFCFSSICKHPYVSLGPPSLLPFSLPVPPSSPLFKFPRVSALFIVILCDFSLPLFLFYSFSFTLSLSPLPHSLSLILLSSQNVIRRKRTQPHLQNTVTS